MNKFISYSEAAAKVKDGMTVMIGGFLGHGTPEGIIDELVKSMSDAYARDALAS